MSRPPYDTGTISFRTNLETPPPAKRYTSLRQAAENHNGSGPKILLLVNAQLVNFGTVKPGRNERIDGVSSSVTLLRLCNARGGYGGRAKAQQHQDNACQRCQQANQNTEIKESGLSSSSLF